MLHEMVIELLPRAVYAQSCGDQMLCGTSPSRATRGCRLQRWTNQLTWLHAILRQAVSGRHHQRSRAALPLRTPLHVARLLRLWDYEAGLGLRVRAHLSTALPGAAACCCARLRLQGKAAGVCCAFAVPTALLPLLCFASLPSSPSMRARAAQAVPWHAAHCAVR